MGAVVRVNKRDENTPFLVKSKEFAERRTVHISQLFLVFPFFDDLRETFENRSIRSTVEPFSIYSRGLKIVRISIKTDRGGSRKEKGRGRKRMGKKVVADSYWLRLVNLEEDVGSIDHRFLSSVHR